MTDVLRSTALGAIAGAAGTTALNAITYADMAWRGRPSSETPQQTVEKLADGAGVELPGDGDTRPNRLEGLGALTGIAAGVATGAVLGFACGLGWRPRGVTATAAAALVAMIAGNGPMTVLGITDPRQWSAVDWLSDVVPHVAYGATTATALRAFLADHRTCVSDGVSQTHC
jgi:hypothetical protein